MVHSPNLLKNINRALDHPGHSLNLGDNRLQIWSPDVRYCAI